MPQYAFRFSDSAAQQLAGLDIVTRKRLGKKLQHFSDSGRPLDFAVQLVNVSPPTYRFRVGKYRIFFEISGHTLQVLAVKRRDQAYRGL